MDYPLAQLDLRYEALRIVDTAAEARLSASIEAYGQREPVLVVRASPEQPAILIDGFRRMRVARRLGHELITIATLPMDETQALLFCHRIAASHRSSALEQAWLVRELYDGHRMTLLAIAEAMARTVSWVSRRIALVQQLPDPVQQHIRSGAICAHAAMRSLVPLARANSVHCEQLAAAAAREHWTTRQLDRIYAAWRSASAEGRDAIAQDPRLALRSIDAIRTPDRIRSVPEARLTEALVGVSRACHRVRQTLLEFVSRDLHRVSMDVLEQGYRSTQLSIRQMDQAVTQVFDARS
jgi:ParB family transcriptional regulator, chromosome partitioning protein